jgi:hypothetical protein
MIGFTCDQLHLGTTYVVLQEILKLYISLVAIIVRDLSLTCYFEYKVRYICIEGDTKITTNRRIK